MNAPLRNMPVAGEVLAVVTNAFELVEAFRKAKAMHGLSNKWCDDICGYADGVTDKKLGPSQTKPIGPLDFSMFCQIFAVKFIMEIDMDAVKRMEAHWEGRVEGKVAVPDSVMSQKLLDKAQPLILKRIGRLGGLKSACQPSARLASRKGGKSRMRKLSKKERVALARMASGKRWSRRNLAGF